MANSGHDVVFALIGGLLVALLLVLWNVMLRRRVQAKTSELSSSLKALEDERRVAEQALARIDATLNALPDLWFEIDLDGRYQNVHAAHAGMVMLPQASLQDTRVTDIMPSDSAAVVMAALAEAHESGRSTGKEFALDLLQGLQWYELSVARKQTLAGEAPRFIALARDITDRKLGQEALRENEERYRTAFITSPDAVNINRLSDGLYIDANDGFLRLMGYSREEVIGRTSRELSIWHDPLDRQRLAQELGRNGHCENLDANFVAKDGHLIVGLMSAHLITIKGEPCILSVTRDISARKQSEDALRVAAAAFDTQEGMFVTDPARVILRINQAFTEITGYSADEAVGKTRRQLNANRSDATFHATMVEEVARDGKWQGEVTNQRKNGELYTEWFTVTAVYGSDRKLTHYVGTLTDISARKAQQQRLEQLAHFDVLTNLPNRALLGDRLRQAMVQAQRRGQTLAVAYIDLDGFKLINDGHGHEVGDQLLIAIAGRMKQALREGDTLARLGGDEFVAVLLDLSDNTTSVPMLRRLLAAAAEPVQTGALNHQVSASVGVTFYPQTQDIDADQLLRQADQAMYQAKLAGKNRFHFFDTKQDSSIRGHHESVGRIAQALQAQEFVLHYQPKVNMRSGAVIGVEALLRWQHPEQGLLPPSHFLPLIQEHPLAIDIGEWVLHQALRQIEGWQAGGLKLPISVNIGARQLQQADFVVRLKHILADHPAAAPGSLQLEVLETSALEDLERAAQVIETCRGLGVSFALDDFGTGYASLSYLKHLRVSLLKIDRSFVRDMLDHRDDLAILEGVIGLAGAFRCQVIAEGVETVAHGALLLQLGCELAQGYCIAPAMPACDLPRWLASWQPDPSWANLSRVSRNNLPALRAAVEYRAWLAALESFLKGEREAPAPIDLQQFRFVERRAWETIESLHHQARELAASLLECHTQGKPSQAQRMMTELHELKDLMLAHLHTLEQESRPGDLLPY